MLSLSITLSLYLCPRRPILATLAHSTSLSGRVARCSSSVETGPVPSVISRSSPECDFESGSKAPIDSFRTLGAMCACGNAHNNSCKCATRANARGRCTVNSGIEVSVKSLLKLARADRGCSSSQLAESGNKWNRCCILRGERAGQFSHMFQNSGREQNRFANREYERHVSENIHVYLVPKPGWNRVRIGSGRVDSR